MLKVTFKQSSTLTSKFQALFFNNATGAITAAAKQLDLGRQQLIDLQQSIAMDWAKCVKAKIVEQLSSGNWMKQPASLTEAYTRRKALAGLDAGIHKAKRLGLIHNLVISARGHGTATVEYTGPASSPFNESFGARSAQYKGSSARDRRAAGFKKTGKNYTKSSIPLANLAASLEFGAGHQTARPFFGPAVEYATEEIQNELPEAMLRALLGPKNMQKRKRESVEA